MQLIFMGQLVEARKAKTKEGKEREGAWKLRFLTMPDGGNLEVTASVLPDDKVKFVPLQWTLEVTARMFQGLLSVTAQSVHGGKAGA